MKYESCKGLFEQNQTVTFDPSLYIFETVGLMY